MKKFFSFLFFFIFIVCCNSSMAYTKSDLINALNRTYDVAGESYTLPASIRTKAINYINSHEISEKDCNELMGLVSKAVAFANEVGTTNIDEVSSEDLKRAMAIVNQAASVLDIEVQVSGELNKVVAAEKSTGKIVEEVEKKPVFFKNTGKAREYIIPIIVGLIGFILILAIYFWVYSHMKNNKLAIGCINSFMIIYILCALPIIIFGNHFEILRLIEPILSSEVGEGHIELVDAEIEESTSQGEGNLVVVTQEDGTEVVVNEKTNKVVKYPSVGEMYAKLSIPACGIELPVYYGDNEKILESGVGHFSGSHFPGEGKGVLYTAHNTLDKLYGLKNIKVGDAVTVNTTYGKFSYKVTSTLVIDDTDKSKANIESNKELLMIYTCYPFDGNGYTDKRYMVYCERSGV